MGMVAGLLGCIAGFSALSLLGATAGVCAIHA